ncbi:hypothetical protein STXM2123_1413 [Streptomyces sp. F-3]|nr:hypothetical protein STXM2123_1413 [Streptomyces sp. F-3]
MFNDPKNFMDISCRTERGRPERPDEGPASGRGSGAGP